MPMQETSLPVGATALKITVNGRDYSILLDTATFDRAGEDGDIPIIPLCRGDEFVGKVLEGQWKKGWDSAMDADQAFTAIIDGSGALEFEGEADVAGVYGYGWINGQHPIILMDETEVTFSMSVPVDDTGAVADRDLYYLFYLRSEKSLGSDTPVNDPNLLSIGFNIDEDGLLLQIYKRVATDWTLLFDGSTYDGASVRAVGDLEGTIWRIVFHDGVAGATSPEDVRHIHIYLKQDDTIANAESATENELTTSPYAIDDWLFDVAYPAFRIGSENTTYYDVGNEAKSTYLRVDYPSLFSLKYDFVDADVGKGDVEIWDGDPDVSTNVQVFDEDHSFGTHDIFVQNGLIRIQLDVGAQYSIILFPWKDATSEYVRMMDQIVWQLDNSATTMFYAHFVSLVKVSSEEIILRVKYTDDATNDNDFFITFDITMKRGSNFVTFQIVATNPPTEDIEHWYEGTPRYRWVYVGDGGVSDNDIATSSINTTLSDNFGIVFDDDQEAFLAIGATSLKPTAGSVRRRGIVGAVYFQSLDGTEQTDQVWIFGIVPFSLIANLFEEAEDGDYTGTTPGNDAAASPPAGNNYVLLDAIGNFQTPAGEYSTYQFDAGTHLPEGRYLAVIRARYVDEETMEMYVWNDDDDVYRNEENAKVTKTLAVTFGYHSVVFDITAADVTGTDTFAIVAEKSTDDADEIRIDYMLIVPIGDGANLPQDLSHSAMRSFNKPRRLYVR